MPLEKGAPEAWGDMVHDLCEPAQSDTAEGRWVSFNQNRPEDLGATVMRRVVEPGAGGIRVVRWQQSANRPERFVDSLRKLECFPLPPALQPAKRTVDHWVSSMAAGIVAEVPVKDGQRVKKGDLLVRLDDAEIRIELKAAEVRLATAKEAYAYAKEKHARGLAPQDEYLKAQSELSLAELDVQRWALKLERTQIKSPADGVVILENMANKPVVGHHVEAGMTSLIIIKSQEEAPKTGASPAPDKVDDAIGALPAAASPSAEPTVRYYYGSSSDASSKTTTAKPTYSYYGASGTPPTTRPGTRTDEHWVHSMAAGIVAEVPVKHGQRVKKGDLLVRLDDAEIKIELKAAEVRLATAQEALERLTRLKERGSVSTEEYRKAESAFMLAKLDVERWSLKLARTRIESPADGIVVLENVANRPVVGRSITAGGDALMIIQSQEEAPKAGFRAPGRGS
jgi:multidrug resistance efflux pump